MLTRLINAFVAATSLFTFTVHPTAGKVNQHDIYVATLPRRDDIGRLHISVTPVHVQILHNLKSNTQKESAAWLRMF